MLLSGRRIISTRPVRAADPLREGLLALGAELIGMPLIETAELPADPAPALARLAEGDWVVLTSPAGAEALSARIRGAGLPTGVKVAAVGPGTTAALKAGGLAVHLVGGDDALALAGKLRELENFPRLSFLLLLGRRADDTLAQGLMDARRVERLDLYETRLVKKAPEGLSERITQGDYDLILFTSPSTVEAFTALGLPAAELRAVSMGAKTSRALRGAGVHPLAEAEPSNAAGLIAAVRGLFTLPSEIPSPIPCTT
ncbi:MAG: uroporphyrinogen-III synthase [Planctomycetes bacterium]|nr:uroporphyrinogen-III synthase [Planctomycetota bacterium]